MKKAIKYFVRLFCIMLILPILAYICAIFLLGADDTTGGMVFIAILGIEIVGYILIRMLSV